MRGSAPSVKDRDDMEEGHNQESPRFYMGPPSRVSAWFNLAAEGRERTTCLRRHEIRDCELQHIYNDSMTWFGGGQISRFRSVPAASENALRMSQWLLMAYSIKRKEGVQKTLDTRRAARIRVLQRIIQEEVAEQHTHDTSSIRHDPSARCRASGALTEARILETKAHGHKKHR